MATSQRRVTFTMLAVITAVISGFLWASSSYRADAATEEPARAAALIESGEGNMVTAKMTGVRPERAGRRGGIHWCPTYEYVVGHQKHTFTEKRLCESAWFRGAPDAELVYEIADPAEHYWVSDFERKSLSDGAESNILWGQWGLGFAGLLGVGALLPVRKRPGRS